MTKVGDQNKQTSDKSCCMTEEGQQKLQDAIRSKSGKYIKGEDNLNYSAIATASKLNRGTVKNILEGHKNLTRSSIERLGNFLGLDLEEDVDFECIDSDSFSTEKSNDNYSSLLITTNTPTAFDLLGRDADRQKLIELSQKHKLVLLKAAAGIGKSTLARHFLETQFTKVIRLEMGLESGNVTPAEEKVSQILRKEFDEEPSRDFQTNLEILKEKLSDKSRPIGVLIDNLEPALDANFRFLEKLRGYEDLLRILGDRDVCSFTLITSRLWLIVQRVKVHEYSLQGLDIKAWREYFHDCENGATSEDLEQMCVAYNGNAKVMDILHGAITNRFDGNIVAYWSRYKDALLADAELETLISVEMNWLRDNQPDAYKLLCRMGCYRYQDVRTVPFEGLICLLWDVPESRQTYVVDYLSKSSLIEFKCEYYLHPAIREMAKYRLLQNTKEWTTTNYEIANFWHSKFRVIKSLEEALPLLEALFHYSELNMLDKILDIFEIQVQLPSNPLFKHQMRRWGYIEFQIQILSKVTEKEKTSQEVVRLLALGACFFLLFNYEQAIKYLEMGNRTTIDSSRWSAYSNLWLARCYLYVGDFSRSLICCDTALKQINNAKDIPDYTQNCSENILIIRGNIYYFLGNYSEAIDEYDAVIKIAKENKNHLEIANALASKVECCINFNKLEEAYQYCQESIQIFERMQDKANIYYAKNLIVKIYASLDNFQDAFTLLKELERESNSTISYGRQINTHLIDSKAIYAYLTKNYESALIYQQKLVSFWLNANSIPQLAETYFQIALIYLKNNEYYQSNQYRQKALMLFKQMDAPNQIERMNKHLS